eukprot:15362553-Alexandrium_andersonii.AAC.1
MSPQGPSSSSGTVCSCGPGLASARSSPRRQSLRGSSWTGGNGPATATVAGERKPRGLPSGGRA